MKRTNIVKLEQPEERLPQVNVPVTPDVKRDVKVACAMARMTQEKWGAMVLALAAKHQIEKGKLPFELPVTPRSSNALHNGIVGVAGSIPVGSTISSEGVEAGKILLLNVGALHEGRAMPHLVGSRQDEERLLQPDFAAGNPG